MMVDGCQALYASLKSFKQTRHDVHVMHHACDLLAQVYQVRQALVCIVSTTVCVEFGFTPDT